MLATGLIELARYNLRRFGLGLGGLSLVAVAVIQFFF
jgi:hypothetical protein